MTFQEIIEAYKAEHFRPDTGVKSATGRFQCADNLYFAYISWLGRSKPAIKQRFADEIEAAEGLSEAVKGYLASKLVPALVDVASGRAPVQSLMLLTATKSIEENAYFQLLKSRAEAIHEFFETRGISVRFENIKTTVALTDIRTHSTQIASEVERLQVILTANEQREIEKDFSATYFDPPKREPVE